jgi:hypothetical protein
MSQQHQNFAMKDRLIPAGAPAKEVGQGGDEATRSPLAAVSFQR